MITLPWGEGVKLLGWGDCCCSDLPPLGVSWTPDKTAAISLPQRSQTPPAVGDRGHTLGKVEPSEWEPAADGSPSHRGYPATHANLSPIATSCIVSTHF